MQKLNFWNFCIKITLLEEKTSQLKTPQSLQTYLIVFKDHSCCWICCWICSHLFDPCRFGRKIIFNQFWVRVDFSVRCRIWRVWRGRRWKGKSAWTSSFEFIIVTPSATSLAENNKIVFTHTYCNTSRYALIFREHFKAWISIIYKC